MQRNTLVPFLFALSLLAGTCTTVQAAECSNEWDGYVIATYRADFWCSEPPSEYTDARCAEKIAEWDNAWSGYADCMHFEYDMPRP
ncbi:MAG TPA: hypothetical protein VM847_17295 [Tahibacter sp.]|nr:hypothetical protein [Tahibacter sp.]